MKINYSVSERRKIKTKQKENLKENLDKQSLQLLHMLGFFFFLTAVSQKFINSSAQYPRHYSSLFVILMFTKMKPEELSLN